MYHIKLCGKDKVIIFWVSDYKYETAWGITESDYITLCKHIVEVFKKIPFTFDGDSEFNYGISLINKDESESNNIDIRLKFDDFRKEFTQYFSVEKNLLYTNRETYIGISLTLDTVVNYKKMIEFTHNYFGVDHNK